MNFLMFVHSSVDDAGLSLKAFRVLGHLHRRAGTDSHTYCRVETIAENTGLNRKTVKEALAELASAGFITRESRPGTSTIYRLAKPSNTNGETEPTRPEKRADPKNGPAQKTDHHPARKTGLGVARKTGLKGYPIKESISITPDFPVFAKPEGKVSGSKKESPADPRHHEITSQIGSRHKAATGQEFIVTGRDVSALKKFLTSWRGSAAEFLATAEKAWIRGRRDPYAKNCLEAASLAGLCARWPQITAELSRPQTGRAAGTPATESGLEGISIRRGVV